MDELIQNPILLALVMLLLGAILSVPVQKRADREVADFRREAGQPEPAQSATWPRWLCRCGGAIVLGLLYAALILAVRMFEVQSIAEVRPDPTGYWLRLTGYLFLLTCLFGATLTDLREYIIPDIFTLPGMVAGIVLATASGDTQLIHLWVDWNQAIPGLRGPWVPEWIAMQTHWHGLAWSVTGAATGAGLVWLVRQLASAILRQEALGLGDVTLMALVGSFTGWQVIVLVLLISPLCAVVGGLLVRLLTNRSFVSFGPWLSFGTVVVLFFWRWIWELEFAGEFSIRRLFGDAQGLALLGGLSLVLLVVLLFSIRLYRMIPGRTHKTESS